MAMDKRAGNFMSETTTRRAAVGPWQAMALFILCWAVVMAAGPLLRSLIPHDGLQSPREIVAFRAAFGLPFSWIALAGTVLILRLRGQTLRHIGWGRPASAWGWLAAAVVTGFFLFNSFRTPSCRGLCFIDPHAWLTDWSAFRLATSVAIGVTAGICEETMFRGFVMGQARDGGAHWSVQILLSGLLFGIAHAGNATLSGRFEPAAAIGIVASTTVFGALFATVYLLGRRSLWPVIVAHGIFAFTTEPWMLLWGLAQTMR
jgi:membrane protease YdiL (CAAX protease family)